MIAGLQVFIPAISDMVFKEKAYNNPSCHYFVFVVVLCLTWMFFPVIQRYWCLGYNIFDSLPQFSLFFSVFLRSALLLELFVF